MNSAARVGVSLAVAGVMLCPVAARGQGLSPEETSAAGAWHTAVRLREELARGSQPDDGLRAAELELLLGRPARARAILEAQPDVAEATPSEYLALMGAIHYAAGEFRDAGDRFREAGSLTVGDRAGVLAARAGDALDRAGLPGLAAEQYRIAATWMPAAAPWLAVREARVTPDTAQAFALLGRAPEQMRREALLAWAELLLAAGDTARAVSAFGGGGEGGKAAELALVLGDTADARALAYEAITGRDTGTVRRALTVVSRTAPPTTPDELLRVARAHRLRGDLRVALEHARLAAAADDAPAAAVVYYGDLLDQGRQRDRALAAYERAAARDDPEAVTAAYKRARLLLRLRRWQPGIEALDAFAEEHAEDRRAPLALFLVADWADDRRQYQRADSLYREVADRWPDDHYASQGRFRIASRRLTAGDTAAALAMYQEESALRGPQRRVAQYFVASLLAARGDSLEARGLWAALAREDSIGYYGTIARDAAGLPPLVVEPAASRSPSEQALGILAVLDFLRAAGFDVEEDILVASLVADPQGSPHEWLDIAEGLIERGRTAEGVRLGWRAARPFTVNHPRVLRAIFPWPMREAIEGEAREFGVDPYLLAALIRQESAFRVDVVSHAGAHGLMQLMPTTARAVARRLGVEWDRTLLHVADANLHFGVSHLATLLKRYRGDVIPSLAAYNAGGTPVARWLRYPEASDPVRFVERIPYTETRGYVRTVLRNRALYRALYPPESATDLIP